MRFFIGLLCGYFFVVFGQLAIEKSYVREGIAKIYGKYYKLTPLNDNGGENDGE